MKLAPSLYSQQRAVMAELMGKAADRVGDPDDVDRGNDARLTLTDVVADVTRFRIYRHNVSANLHGALSEVYPVIMRLVGAEFFRQLTRRYMTWHPPCSGDLHGYGVDLARFLASYEPTNTLPYLPDVARLEWALHRAFHAPERPSFTLGALAEVHPRDYGALRFHIHPACRLLTSPFPIDRIWHANVAGDAGTTIDAAAGAVQLCVFRADMTPSFLSLNPGAFCLLRALTGKQRWETAVTAALSADASLNIEQALLEWIGLGIVYRFSLDS